MSVQTITKAWPQAVRLLVARGMASVGCPLVEFSDEVETDTIEIDPRLARIAEVSAITRARFPQSGYLQFG